jgi:hypothetical protein
MQLIGSPTFKLVGATERQAWSAGRRAGVSSWRRVVRRGRRAGHSASLGPPSRGEPWPVGVLQGAAWDDVVEMADGGGVGRRGEVARCGWSVWRGGASPAGSPAADSGRRPRRPGEISAQVGAHGERSTGCCEQRQRIRLGGQGYNGHSMSVWFKIQMNLGENPPKGK